jgi:hypothetical protein
VAVVDADLALRSGDLPDQAVQQGDSGEVVGGRDAPDWLVADAPIVVHR